MLLKFKSVSQHHSPLVINDAPTRDTDLTTEHQFANVLNKAEVSQFFDFGTHLLLIHTQNGEGRIFVHQHGGGHAVVVDDQSEADVFCPFILATIETHAISQDSSAIGTSFDETRILSDADQHASSLHSYTAWTCYHI